jgi:hypothetical protein
MDLPFWALGLGSPTKIEAKGTPIPDADNASMPNTLQVDYHFPNGVHLTWYHGVPGPSLDGSVTFDKFGNGVLFEGSKGKLVADYSKYRVLGEFARDFKAPDPSIPKSVGHHKEWLDAIRTGGKTTCHFGYSAPLAEAALLGNVAYRAGTGIEWDAKAGKVTNAPAAMKYVRCETRKGWELT